MNDLQETIAELVGEGAAIRVAVAALIRQSADPQQLESLLRQYDEQTVQVLAKVSRKMPDFADTATQAYREVLAGLASQLAGD